MTDRPKRSKRPYGTGLASTVALRLTEAERQELEALAAREGVSLSQYLRQHLLRERGKIVGPAR